MIAPRDFIDRWAKSDLREQQAAQSHFNELCQLVGHKTPTQLDPEGKVFTFEENVTKATGGRGRADVWYKGRFAWEYKGKHKDLDAAYAQLLAYRGDLGNPPLLVVCDFLEYRIYPQWPNTSGQPFVFRNEELDRPDTLRYITWLLEDPEQFLQLRQSELAAREQITLGLAYQFAHLADLMREHAAGEGWTPFQIARFLTKLVFTLFTEDVGLLPTIGKSQSALRFIIEGAKREPESFVDLTRDLFAAMNGDRRLFITYPVPYFNGGLFADSAPGSGDGLEVLDLTHIPGAINLLEEASERDWRKVNPTIFGTLFEGALDVSKRAQLGAHYTGEADIRLVIEPVLMEPLYREWEAMQVTAAPLLQTLGNPTAAARPLAEAREQLTALHDQMMNRLGTCRILDPACGSGNFLYVSLRALKDLESKVRKFFEPLGLPFRDVVTPRQLYGIEKDEFAARLAHVVVWIGYLQWRYEDEGVLHPYLKATSSPHPRQLPNPIIQDKAAPDEPDRIQNADAILRYDAAGKPIEPDWPEVDVIVGNPPFLGGNRIRSELGSTVDELFSLYDGRVPAFADLVCYWFEKARAHIESGKAGRAGLLATNSIRGGVNRAVLERIKQTGEIFYAWSDRPWVLEGAAVRISIVGFQAPHPLAPSPADQGRGTGKEGTPDSPPQSAGEGLGVGSSALAARPETALGGWNNTGESRFAHTWTKEPDLYEKIKPFARQMRREQTPAEAALWERLRKKGVQGAKFRRQHPVDRFILDFYCAPERLAIEVDGPIHDYTQEQDALRQAYIESLGIRVLRFTNDQVFNAIDDVLAAIEAALSPSQRADSSPSPALPREKSPPPAPPQRTEEGSPESPFPGLPGTTAGRLGDGEPDASIGDFFLDGRRVRTINADLTADVNIVGSSLLEENAGMSFQGPSPKGSFDISSEVAQKLLAEPNASPARSNTDVVRPVLNGADIVQRNRGYWTIDFPPSMSLEDAKLYLAPFEYVKRVVYPERQSNNRLAYREKWWMYAEARPGMRTALEGLSRYIATPRVAKHRVFIWAKPEVMCNDAVIVFARADDYFFGVLHSYAHECWSLRKGTFLGVGNDPRYTPTTTFETFPFPWSPGQEDTASPHHAAISAAAAQLHAEREAWLNPPDLIALGADSKALKERTLTNLYNAVVALREGKNGNGHGNGKTNGNGNGKGEKLVKAARDFAPRLVALHDALDAAVLAAYGWSDLVGRLRSAEGDEELLRRLLALNAARSSP